MSNPVVDLIGDRTGRIVPIYPQSEKADLATWEIAGWVENALDALPGPGHRGPDAARGARPPSTSSGGNGRCSPSTCRSRWPRRRRPAADWPSTSCCGSNSSSCCASRPWSGTPRGIRHDRTGALVGRFHAQLPFELTDDQRAVIAEIEADLAGSPPHASAAAGRRGIGQDGGGRERPADGGAGRLPGRLHGAHRGAGRAARLSRHRPAGRGDRARRRRACSRTGPCGWRSSPTAVAAATAGRSWPGWPTGRVDIVIGTHALIQEGVRFAGLGVVVIDEQHRFGVEQRAALRAKGEEGEARCPTCW